MWKAKRQGYRPRQPLLQPSQSSQDQLTHAHCLASVGYHEFSLSVKLSCHPTDAVAFNRPLLATCSEIFPSPVLPECPGVQKANLLCCFQGPVLSRLATATRWDARSFWGLGSSGKSLQSAQWGPVSSCSSNIFVLHLLSLYGSH